MTPIARLAALAAFAACVQFVQVVNALAEQTLDHRIPGIIKAGRLRVGFGMNPTLAVKDPSTGALRGPAFDLATALAKRMSVALEPIALPSPGAAAQGIADRAFDVTFLVIDPARTAVMEFSAPYMESDFTYLVAAGSKIARIAEIDVPGIRIAVVRNDASDLRLTQLIKQAELVRVDDINVAAETLRAAKADAVAAPRPVLAVQRTKVPGSQLLEEGFARISYAVVVSKGRSDLLSYINDFVDDAKASGLVKNTIEAAGLQGVRVPPKP